MNCPAASSGVSIEIFIIAPRGGELNLYPPLEDSSAAGGDLSASGGDLSAAGGLNQLCAVADPIG